MSAQVQQIIVFVILAIVAIIVVRHIIDRYKHRHDNTCSSNCHNCPYADCASRKKTPTDTHQEKR